MNKNLYHRFPLKLKLLQKVGTIFFDLSPFGNQQALFDAPNKQKSEPIMAAMDKINQMYGRGALTPAAVQAKWRTKFDMKSACYTTRLEELPIARA